MESKKLQQLQQANSHLAPQPMPQKRPAPPFHPTKGDYRSPRLTGLQSHLQCLNLSANCSPSNLTDQNSTLCQQPPRDVSPTSHMQSKPNTHNAYKQQSSTNHYLDEHLFQNISPERIYQMAPTRSHYNSLVHSHSHPVQSLQQQYQQLQQAKMKQQIQTQNEALVQQQRTFALRQQLNPPIPQSHFHIQSPVVLPTMVTSQLQQPSHQQSSHKNVPPSTLNLSSQFQPAPGPMKMTNMEMRNQHYHKDEHNEHIVQAQKAQSQLIYLHNKQMQQQIVKSKLETITPGEQGPVYIQQNHPGHVVNQACQTQISGAIGSKTKTPTESPKSPLHQSIDRKKSAIAMQSLKSPVTKRPVPSSVKISGWLYKQGSDGLKVWRKRWFVLSDYCLYYYKGPEEEKLLGSILLPSYRVAACAVEDKIYRKYAFKCEHTNMRTYWLAAENSDTMGQWIRALTAATMMQASSESSDQTSQPSVSSLNHSCENSDSGIHTFQSQQSKISIPQGPVTPVSDSGGVQPLYANAPPKPRRVNDGGYSSPSPENSLERCDMSTESRYQTSAQYTQRNDIKSPGMQLQNQQPALQQAIYDTRTGHVTSALKVGQTPQNIEILTTQFQQFDNNKSRYQRNDYVQSPLLQQQIVVDNQRAAELEQHIIRAPQRFNDELYGERDLYMQRTTNQKHPMQVNYAVGYPNAERRTPDAYGRSKSGQSRQFSHYEDIYNLTQNQNISQNQLDLSRYRRPLSPPSYNSSKHVPSILPRYATNQLENGIQQNVLLQNRPLQSSGIARPHSADFLEYEARANFADSLKADSIQTTRPKSSLDINRNPDSYYYSEASYAEKMRQSALYLQKPQNASQNFFISPHCAAESTQLLTGSNTLLHDNQYGSRKQIETISKKPNEGIFSVPRTHRSNVKDCVTHQNEQFLRSASARLPRKDEDSATKDGERKREESMKRLLEWKQRMLQSPLTRKGVQQGTTSISKLASNTKNTSHGIQKSCSDTHANAGYNSYSSDDEASVSVRNMRNLPINNLTVLSDSSDQIVKTHSNNTNSYYTNDLEPKHESNRGFYSKELDIAISKNIAYQDCVNSYMKSGCRTEIDLLERETSSQIRNLDMSAGDLLSRTHEELVLLLIQLRRQNSTTARTIEQCCTDIHEIQNRIRTSDGQTRTDNILRLDYLKQHLLDLEKQYEKSKPLVNLVDNMVKLGSLYKNNENTKKSNYSLEAVTLDPFEFNQKLQERRLLQEEKKHWDRISPNHTELQSKVEQLYQLDQLLQEESGTLQSLQRDKEDLEKALGGLRARLQDNDGPSVALEAAKKQQHTLERELSRVHQLLAENSKKLEQTVAGNARLEQELLILRQKLQASRGSRGSQGTLGGNQGVADSIQYASSTTALLESELRRVQKLVGDMQRQRQELSQAVRQLTENSNSLYQQIGTPEIFNSSHIKKRLNSACWTETDLDTMVSVDHLSCFSSENLNLDTPLYIDTSSANSSSNLLNCSSSSKLSQYDFKNMRNYRNLDPESSGVDSDDFLENSTFGSLTNQEKQEIKTVRIVKRESERRHRDRDRGNVTSASNLNLHQVLEEESRIHPTSEESHYSRSQSLPRTYNETYEPIKQKSLEQSKFIPFVKSNSTFSSNSHIPINYTEYYTNANANPYPVSIAKLKKIYVEDTKPNISCEPAPELNHKTESIQSLSRSITDLSPVFQSEAARQIIIEMAGSVPEGNEKGAHNHRRSVPKEKRRHYTAPNNVIAKAMSNIQADNDMNRNNTNWRARDDLDMEVALRPRINAPDVVRSALGHRENISENTIDKLLAAPSKIVIPERYIPEQIPELTPEERKRRQEKVEAIKKMLSDAPINSSKDTINLPSRKVNSEKQEREHLLQLNQILAQQVMQMSKIVAGNPCQSNQK